MFEKIQKFLIENANEKVALSGQRFFKTPILIHGVSTPRVHKFSREIFREMKKLVFLRKRGIKNFENELIFNNLFKLEIFSLCERLWKTGFLEECIVACNFSDFVAKDFETKDFLIFEKWILNYVKNWATCDTFCNHSVGDFLMKFPDFVSEMKRWAKSDNLWLRRAGAVSLILPVRKGLFLEEVFEIAEILLNDKEDLVQKGYGWMLKVASKPFLQEVFEFVLERKAFMPRTALRYAIEKMPKEMRRMAMES